MTLISTVTVGSGGGSITLSNIPQTFTDLYLVYTSREGGVSGQTFVGNFLRFNASSATNYSNRRLLGNGSSVSSASSTSQDALFVGSNGAANSTANTWSSTSIYIPNYTGSTQKSLSIENVVENNATAGEQFLIAGLWSLTSAITQIDILPQISFSQNTTASLYGILKGSGGATVS